jgi:hypothetical protein
MGAAWSAVLLPLCVLDLLLAADRRLIVFYAINTAALRDGAAATAAWRSSSPGDR